MYLLSAVGYSCEEALAELWRNRLVNVVAIGTIAVSLFVLGIITTLSLNLSRVLAGWSDKVQLTLYLREGIVSEDLDSLERSLRQTPGVGSFEFISKEDAVRRFRAYFAELGTLPEMLKPNPFPASFEIQVTPNHRDPEKVRELSTRLASHQGVEEADYDQLWVERLTAVIDLVRVLGLFVGGALVVAAVFTIFNVIKLTVYGRQGEISIMRLVGATPAYIRGPFLVEGMLQGGLGGSLALLLLHGAHWLLVRHVLLPARLLVGAEWLELPSAAVSASIVAGGMLLGLAGSLLSVRRFLTGMG
ncbi:MAG: permease-like cell division protein FtsX [Acidobacteria bacterium]|nr:permease-like cell division protein FtsX [Acidobacteriota bacterium]